MSKQYSVITILNKINYLSKHFCRPFSFSLYHYFVMHSTRTSSEPKLQNRNRLTKSWQPAKFRPYVNIKSSERMRITSTYYKVFRQQTEQL